MDLNEPGKPEDLKETAPAPEAKPAGRLLSRQGKTLLVALLVVFGVATLYLVQRYWISPALKTQAMNDGDHPDAPAISLTDIEGKKLELADYKGKVVVLDFWATWCEPCRVEIPGLVELQDKYARQGFTVLGISMDDGPDPVVSFYKQFRLNYPVAVGTPRVGELYGGIMGLPTTFVIGRDGRIYAKHVGAVGFSVLEDEVQQLLAMSATAEKADFQVHKTAGTASKIELGDPEAINSEIPGLNLSKLSNAQKETLKKQLNQDHCPCGCNMTLFECRQKDYKCPVSLKMAKDAMEKILKSGA
jgi:thiol-disulfide isomerase/thioredoxin